MSQKVNYHPLLLSSAETEMLKRLNIYKIDLYKLYFESMFLYCKAHKIVQPCTSSTFSSINFTVLWPYHSQYLPVKIIVIPSNWKSTKQKWKCYNACHFQLEKIVTSVFHVQGVKAYGEIGVKLYWKWVVRFTPQLLCPRESTLVSIK
jgi:hypothetical protein